MKDQILAVQRMQEYIEEHFTEEITPADLSREALFSPWYSYRLFLMYTGKSPAEYIRKLRVTEAAKRLKSQGCQVTKTAFDLGFGSVDGFIRAFSREFGMTPGDYRLKPVPIPLFIPYGVKFKEVAREEIGMEKVRNVFIQVVHKPKRKVILRRGIEAKEYWSYCNEVGCDVWGILMSMDSLCGEPVCLWLPKKYILPGTSPYVQGVEVDTAYAGVVPEHFDTITLPAADYLMFQGEPFREEDYGNAIMAVQQAMDQYAPSGIGYVWDDESPRIQLEPRGERGYIELRAVKPR